MDAATIIVKFLQLLFILELAGRWETFHGPIVRDVSQTFGRSLVRLEQRLSRSVMLLAAFLVVHELGRKPLNRSTKVAIAGC
jgi:hypothetical protein